MAYLGHLRSDFPIANSACDMHVTCGNRVSVQVWRSPRAISFRSSVAYKFRPSISSSIVTSEGSSVKVHHRSNTNQGEEEEGREEVEQGEIEC